MNRAPDPDQNDLLADVLAETEPPDFRAALLGQTLRLARRRRHLRQARRALPVAAALFAVGWLIWKSPSPSALFMPPVSSSLVPPVAGRFVRVRTQALPPATIVSTQPFASERQITTLTSVTTIRTPLIDPAVRIINDAELLAFAAPRPAALVRVGPSVQELIFIDEEAP